MTRKTLPNGQIVQVTPALAAEMLAKNSHNRNVRQLQVQRLAADMLAGDWLFTGDPIRLNGDGTVIDGQHRLEAVRVSGMTIPFVVIRGLDSSAQEVIDSGIPRKFGDVLQLKGERNPSSLSALAKLAMAWSSGGDRRAALNRPVGSNRQLLRFLDAHPELRDYAQHEQRAVADAANLPPSIVALAWWMFDQIDPDDAKFFFQRLREDVGHSKGEPIYELRRTLNQASANVRAVRSRVWMIAITIKAWNAYRDGATVGAYRWAPGGARPEAFPEPQ